MKFKNIVGIGIVIWLVNYFGGENGIFKRWFGHQPESRRIEYVERSPGLADVDDQAKGLASRFIEWIGFYNEADAAIHSNHNRHVAEEAWRDTTRINTEIERTKLQRRIQDLDHRERNQKLREQNASWQRQRQAANDAQRRADRLAQQRREAQKAADQHAKQVVRYNKSH